MAYGEDNHGITLKAVKCDVTTIPEINHQLSELGVHVFNRTPDLRVLTK